MDILKIAVLGIAGTLFSLLLQKERREYSLFVSMAVCICIFVWLLTKLETVLQFVAELFDFLPIDKGYIALMLRMIGVTYVAEFAIHICKDAGYGAIGSQMEAFAKMSILVISIPVLRVFLETIQGFL